jgi:hypothetical protein
MDSLRFLITFNSCLCFAWFKNCSVLLLLLLVGNPEGKRPIGRPIRRLADNIRMELGEVGWGDVDWIGLSEDKNRWRALVNSVLILRVPWNAGKLSGGLASNGLSSSVQLHRVS